MIKSAAAALKAAFKSRCTFSNIAEGTHAGSITMTAGAEIDSSGLVLCADASSGSVKIAGAADLPIGVSADESQMGEALAVILPGCAESTIMCISASEINTGDTLYTAAGGKVSAIAADGAFKVGRALCAASSGSRVEVDPQGFGERAWQVYACGVYAWQGSESSESMPCAGTKTDDIVFACVQNSAASESVVNAAVSAEDTIGFKLSSAGTPSTTKIAWMIIRKN